MTESLSPTAVIRVSRGNFDPARFEEVDRMAEARAEMSRTMPAEYVEAFFRFFSEGEYDDSPVLRIVEALAGRRPHIFEQWALAHAKAFL